MDRRESLEMPGNLPYGVMHWSEYAAMLAERSSTIDDYMDTLCNALAQEIPGPEIDENGKPLPGTQNIRWNRQAELLPWVCHVRDDQGEGITVGFETLADAHLEYRCRVHQQPVMSPKAVAEMELHESIGE